MVLALMLHDVSAQLRGELTLRGRVTDTAGAAVPFAGIQVSAAGRLFGGTVADDGGRFAVEQMPAGQYSLTVSLMGYEAQTLSVQMRADTSVVVVLAEAAHTVAEVLVTASEVQGITSASRIDRTAMNHLQPTSFSELLELLPGGKSTDPVSNKASLVKMRVGLKMIIFMMRGNLIQYVQVRIKKQRPMMKQTSAGILLCTSGYFPVADRDVAGTVFPGRNANRIQCINDRRETAVIIYKGIISQNQRIINISQIMINSAASGHAADDWNLLPAQRFHLYFPANILITAYYDSRGIAPEPEYIIIQDRFKYNLFKSLVIKRIQRRIF